jgi:hypothetical protein
LQIDEARNYFDLINRKDTRDAKIPKAFLFQIAPSRDLRRKYFLKYMGEEIR